MPSRPQPPLPHTSPALTAYLTRPCRIPHLPLPHTSPKGQLPGAAKIPMQEYPARCIAPPRKASLGTRWPSVYASLPLPSYTSTFLPLPHWSMPSAPRWPGTCIVPARTWYDRHLYPIQLLSFRPLKPNSKWDVETLIHEYAITYKC